MVEESKAGAVNLTCAGKHHMFLGRVCTSCDGTDVPLVGEEQFRADLEPHSQTRVKLTRNKTIKGSRFFWSKGFSKGMQLFSRGRCDNRLPHVWNRTGIDCVDGRVCGEQPLRTRGHAALCPGESMKLTRVPSPSIRPSATH